MNLLVTISGQFADDMTDEDVSEMKEDLEEECRHYWHGSGITVEVERS